MDFDKLIENLTELAEKGKPVSGLLFDFYNSLTSNIPELGKLVDTAKGIFIIVIVVLLFYRVVSD